MPDLLSPCTLAVVGVQVAVMTQWRFDGVVVMLVWLWPLSVGLTGVTSLAMDVLPARVRELLADVQRTLLERARTFRDEHTQRVEGYEAFKQAMEGRPGFVIAPWCGSTDCETHIKTETQATIRNMPAGVAVRQGQGITAAHGAAAPQGLAPQVRCVRCDNPAIAEAWFAKSY